MSMPVLIYRPRKDERLSYLCGWLYQDGFPTDGHPSKY